MAEIIKKIRLFGAGGHSKIIQLIAKNDGVEIVEIFDDQPQFDNLTQQNITWNARKNPRGFSHKGHPFIIAIGNNYQRAEIAHFIKSEFYKIIHPSAVIASNTKIGMGTVIYAGAVIQPNTTIGKHVIINTSASVDYDNSIDDFAHISPNAALCGKVEIGEGSHIGAGAVIISNVKIGKWSIIGAGTVVLKDVPDYAVVVGNPGKIIKINNPKTYAFL